MSETATGATGADVGDARVERFERDIEAIGHRAGRGDRRWIAVGLAGMALGIALTVVAYVGSTGQSDQRDVLSSAILAVVGLSVVVTGAAVFVWSALIDFLRFWMLRLLATNDPGISHPGTNDPESSAR